MNRQKNKQICRQHVLKYKNEIEIKGQKYKWCKYVDEYTKHLISRHYIEIQTNLSKTKTDTYTDTHRTNR